MGQHALHDGCELEIAATDVLEEAVELQRVVGVVVVHHGHAVPFHLVFVQQLYAAHHLDERGLSLPVSAVLVVELLRPVDGHAHKPMVVVEEAAPLVGEHRAVGLYAVVYRPAAGVLALQVHGLAVESERAHQRLAPVPGEEYLWLRLRVEVLLDEAFQQLVAHHLLGVIGI